MLLIGSGLRGRSLLSCLFLSWLGSWWGVLMVVLMVVLMKVLMGVLVGFLMGVLGSVVGGFARCSTETFWRINGNISG